MMRFEVVVPTWITSYDESNSSFTQFVVEIRDPNGVTITLNKRYSAFETLHKQLRARTQRLPQLPGKKLFHSNPTFIEERRIGLETYLKSVVHLAQQIALPELHDFLELTRLVEKVEKKPKRKVVLKPSDSISSLGLISRSVKSIILSDNGEFESVDISSSSMSSSSSSSSSVSGPPPLSSYSRSPNYSRNDPTDADKAKPRQTSKDREQDPIVFHLSQNEKIFLKEMLLEVIVDEELQLFFTYPTIETIEEKTILLRYAREFLLDFPWFKNDRDLIGLLDELILMIPKIIPAGSRATRTDWYDAFKSDLLLFFSLFLSTKEEDDFLTKLALQKRQGAQTETSPSEKSELQDKGKKVASPKSFKVECTKCHWVQLNDTLRTLILDIQNSTDAKAGTQAQARQISKEFFNVFRQADTLSQAPPIYKDIFGCFRNMLASWMREASDEMNVKKAKALLKMVPITSIKVALSLGDPIKLLRQFLSIFFARPFGARSLVMRQIEVITDFKKSDREQKEFKRLFPTWQARIEPIVDKHHEQLKRDISLEMLQTIRGAEGHKVLYYNQRVLTLLKEELSKDKSIPRNKQSGMTVDSLLRMFWLEVRNRDKMELINSIGDKKLYKIIKRIILAIEPALSFLGVVDLPDYVGKLFNIFKTLNIIAEKNLLEQNKLSAPLPDDEEDLKDENEGVTKKEDLEKMFGSLDSSQYGHILDAFANLLYKLVHDIIVADTKAQGKLETIIDWFLGKVVEVKKKSIRIQEDVLLPVLPLLTDEQIVRLITHLKQRGVTSHLFQHPAIEENEMNIETDPSLIDALKIVGTQFLSYVSDSLYSQ